MALRVDLIAEVAKLADARASNTRAFGHGGSTPLLGTNFLSADDARHHDLLLLRLVERVVTSMAVVQLSELRAVSVLDAAVVADDPRELDHDPRVALTGENGFELSPGVLNDR